MQKFIEMTGRNEEMAIQAALEKLGLDRDDVSVEVLERPKSGFLGIGGTPAKVKVTYEVPDEVPVVEAPPVIAPKPIEKKAPVSAPAPERTAPPAPKVSKVPAEDDDQAERIAAFLTGLMEHMNVSAVPRVSLGAEGAYDVELVGEGLGAIIGRRGETLDAIQQLCNYTVNRGQSKRVRVHVDAEGYRVKREESLVRLAQKVAGKVVRYRRNVTLEPMNAYERHVIHTALQDYPEVSTYSTGTEPNRRTVVAYGKVDK